MFEVSGNTINISKDNLNKLFCDGCPIVVGGNIMKNKTDYPYFVNGFGMQLNVLNNGHSINERLIFHHESFIIDEYDRVSDLIGYNSTPDYKFEINNEITPHLKYYNQMYLDLLEANRIDFVCDVSYSRKLLLDNVLSPSLHHVLVTTESNIVNKISDIECEDMIIMNNVQDSLRINFTRCNIKRLTIVIEHSYHNYNYGNRSIVINDVKELHITDITILNDVVRIVNVSISRSRKYSFNLVNAGHVVINNTDIVLDSCTNVSAKIINSNVYVKNNVVFSNLSIKGSENVDVRFENIKFVSSDSLLVVNMKSYCHEYNLPNVIPTNNFKIVCLGDLGECDTVRFKNLMLDDRYDFRFSRVLERFKNELSAQEMRDYNYGVNSKYFEDRIEINNDDALDLVMQEMNEVSIIRSTIINLNVSCTKLFLYECIIKGPIKIDCVELQLVENVKIDRMISVEINSTKLNTLTLINKKRPESHMIEYDDMTALINESNIDNLYLSNAIITSTINVDHIKRVKLINCTIMHLINRFNDTVKMKGCMFNKITKNH